nr:PIN-like domain-containing protein [Streptococcus suis]
MSKELSNGLNIFFQNGENSNKKYIIDTNYLLNIFSFENGSKYFEALKMSSEKLYIPFIVWLELCYNVDNKKSETDSELISYQNYLKKIDKEKSKFKVTDIKTKISDIFQQAIIKNSDQKGERHNKSIVEILKKVETKEVADLLDKLNIIITNSIDEWKQGEAHKTSEEIKGHIKETEERFLELQKLVLDGTIQVGEPYSDDRLEQLLEECNAREKQNIPPVNSEEDLAKSSVKRWGSLSIPAKYGDMLVWLEMLDIAQKDNNKDIEYILVSDDVEKDDWLHQKTNKLFPAMRIEFFSKTEAQVSHLKAKDFIMQITKEDVIEVEENLNSDADELSAPNSETKHIASAFDELVSDESETIDFNDYFEDYSKDDTVIVPARSTGFREVFLGENRWYSIRMKDDRIKYIKYIAAYQTYPKSEITYIAEVDDIIDSPYASGKKMILFKSQARKLKKSIPLGTDTNAFQGPRYTNIINLLNADNTDDIFRKEK